MIHRDWHFVIITYLFQNESGNTGFFFFLKKKHYQLERNDLQN